MANDKIVIKGAREHNLKNIDITLPRDKFIVMTGLSGSGNQAWRSTPSTPMASAAIWRACPAMRASFWARWKNRMWTRSSGLSPAISIDQKTTSKNPRSTVGTVTEIYDYLRLLYARIGVPHCPVCGRPISQQTVDQMVDEMMELPEGTRFQVLAPVVRGRKGTQSERI